MLSVREVGIGYGAGSGRVQALDEVSLDFRPANLTLVMGPSGSGKTTLLSLLGCLLTPDRGEVSVMNAPIRGLSEEARGRIRRRYIGYVFQAFRLFHSLSALENVTIAMEICGQHRRKSREPAMRALESVGLADRWRLKPGELSGGEKQRVAIARALVNDPPIILADEPTASLDSASGLQITQTLRRLADEDQRLVVVVSHDPRWLPFSDRTVTLQDGRVLDDSDAPSRDQERQQPPNMLETSSSAVVPRAVR
jgi:putative ABC transport system ATP-binding protein